MAGLTEQDKEDIGEMFYPTLKRLGEGIQDISRKQEKSNERLIRLETLTETFEKLLERECTDREKEDSEIKENYISRFETVFLKLDKLIEIVLPLKTIVSLPDKPEPLKEIPAVEKTKMRYRYVKLIIGLLSSAAVGAIILKLIGG